MNNLTRKQDVLKNTEDKGKLGREALGKFFYDLAKLVFAAMVLVGGVSLITTDEPQIKQGVLAVIGLLLTYIFAAIGYSILKK